MEIVCLVFSTREPIKSFETLHHLGYELNINSQLSIHSGSSLRLSIPNEYAETSGEENVGLKLPGLATFAVWYEICNTNFTFT